MPKVLLSLTSKNLSQEKQFVSFCLQSVSVLFEVSFVVNINDPTEGTEQIMVFGTLEYHKILKKKKVGEKVHAIENFLKAVSKTLF